MRSLIKNVPSVSGATWRTLLVLMSILVTTTANAGCPDPKGIHPQEIKDATQYALIEGQPLLIGGIPGSGSTEWISSSYKHPDSWSEVPILRSVQIVSLEPNQHGLVCIYSFGEDLRDNRFKMVEPVVRSTTAKIILKNKNEWNPYFTYKGEKYGYLCETSKAQCEWDYDR